MVDYNPRQEYEGVVTQYANREGTIVDWEGNRYPYHFIAVEGIETPRPFNKVTFRLTRSGKVASVSRQGEGSADMPGTFKWFDEEKGYGFIVSPLLDIDFFAHHEEVEFTPQAGDVVKFKPVMAKRGPKATSIQLVHRSEEAEASSENKSDPEAEAGTPETEEVIPSDRRGILMQMGTILEEGIDFLLDGRISTGPKLIPILGLAYVISPVDLLPAGIFGPLGMGDDIGLMFFTTWLFVKLCHRQIEAEPVHSEDENNVREEDVVEGKWRVVS